MHKNYYDGPPEYRPLSAWEYFGYGLLIAIPIVGFVMMLYYSFDNSDRILVDYYRSSSIVD